MCGITGVVDFGHRFDISEALLMRMAEPLKFRGPDAGGVSVIATERARVGFAHRRLSIIDLSENANQPFVSNSGNTVIVFNGEIYNYHEIRTKLLADGRKFRTHSDTEVIAEAYETAGIEKTLDLLDGMFAFAIWDKKDQKLILARDRFGEKPLYLYNDTTALAFSSDIRSFYPLNVPLEIDPHALCYYFQELSTPAQQSIWKNIIKLEPACYCEFSVSGLIKKKYYTPDFTSKAKLTTAEAIDQSEYLLRAAVKKAMVADVSLGTFLSGGIDSSLVTLFAARESGKTIRTFTVGFDFEPFNELPFSRAVARLAETEHLEIILSPDDLKVAATLIQECGEPFADSSLIPTYYVSRFAAQNVKVALGGDGGDEIFCGYPTHVQAKRMRQWHDNRWLLPFVKLVGGVTGHSKLPYLIGLMNRDNTVLASALHRSMGFSFTELGQLLPDLSVTDSAQREFEEALKEMEHVSNSVFDSLVYGSVKTRLPNDYLVKTDRASMYASLELRSPFLNRKLFEFTASLDDKTLMKGAENKYLTKQIALKYFPKSFVYRRKMGFGIPVGDWIKSIWKREFLEVIHIQDNSGIDISFVERLYKEHCDGKRDHSNRLWSVFVFKEWMKHHTSFS